jgi:chaperonin GroEL
MHRDVVLGDDARKRMKRGIDTVADTVKVTMGVRGKNVILDTNPYTKPLITNDGVTIARDLIIEDRVENIGAKQIREVAERTNDNAGDGTTTSMLLMQSIITQGMRAIDSGADGIALREGIRTATQNIVKSVEAEKVDASDESTLADTATISCRDPEIGKLIAKVVKQAGSDGMVTIEDRVESDTIYEKYEGLKLRGGYLLDFFINLPERRQSVFNDVPILVTSKPITMAEEMGKIMETVANMGKKEAVIIASSIEGNALLTALKNWHSKAIFILPVRVLAYGEAGIGALKDVAAITGATFLDEHEKNIIDITPEDFGVASKTVTDKNETTIISDDDKLKKERVKDLQAALKDAPEFEAESLRERIAKLKSAMFTIKVGGKTESERNELKTRVDDAIKASKAALESGVVAGGGSALYRAAHVQKTPDVTTDEGLGENVVYKACTTPIKQMALNSNHNLDRSDYTEILDKTKAVDFKSCTVVDAFKAGIVDPLKVVTECIENASSGAALFLTLEGAVMDVQPAEAEKI